MTIFGGGNGNGMSSMSDNVPLVMAKTIQTIKEATGVDIAEIMRAESYDAKTTKNVNVTGMTEKKPGKLWELLPWPKPSPQNKQ